jgi:hypothetical protein
MKRMDSGLRYVTCIESTQAGSKLVIANWVLAFFQSLSSKPISCQPMGSSLASIYSFGAC